MPIDRPSKWGYVLLPLAAPHRPPRGAGPLRALHTGGRQQLSPPPAAVEATTSLGWPIGIAATRGRRGRPLVPSSGSTNSRSRRASPLPECLQEGCKHSVLVWRRAGSVPISGPDPLLAERGADTKGARSPETPSRTLVAVCRRFGGVRRMLCY